ncbi:MAG: hypothetical protein KDA37_11480 [Planctomycetales bacterium]|nr:hypothetical protein [Planctomycetales bacterium]
MFCSLMIAMVLACSSSPAYAFLTVLSQEADASIEDEGLNVTSDFSAAMGPVDLQAALGGSLAEASVAYGAPGATEHSISGAVSAYAQADQVGEQRSVNGRVDLVFELERAGEYSLVVDNVLDGPVLFSLVEDLPVASLNIFTDSNNLQSQGEIGPGTYLLYATAFAFAEGLGPASESSQLTFSLLITSVPEPAGATLLVAGFALAMPRRRRE